MGFPCVFQFPIGIDMHDMKEVFANGQVFQFPIGIDMHKQLQRQKQKQLRVSIPYRDRYALLQECGLADL